MSSIPKSDKQIWENYITNFGSFSFNLKNRKKNLVKKKSFSASKLSPLQKEKKNIPQGILDLHGYRLKTAKIILHNYIINAYEKKINDQNPNWTLIETKSF